ncbi:MAG: hypothetical protein ACYC3L_16435 [Gemmatimonadaceae bacterium]
MVTNLLQAAADTLVFRQVPPVRTGFEQAVFVSAGLAQIVTLFVVILLVLIFWRMWKAQLAIQEQLGRLTSKVDPMIASATSAAENVRVLTDAVKTDAVAAAEALSEATERVRDSVAGVADRVDDFSDLLGRLHQKADSIVDVAGAAMTTLKWGANALNPAARRRKRRAAEEEVEPPVRRRRRRLPRDEDEDAPEAPPVVRRDPDLDAPPEEAPRRPRRRRPSR